MCIRDREREISGAEILPVDSEHSAIWQCLRAGSKEEVQKMCIRDSVPLLLQCCGYLLGTVLLITVDVQGLQHSWLVFTGGVVLLLCVVLFGFADYSFEQAGAALLGVCYVPMLLSYLLLLRALPQGQKLTVLTFVLTWTVDLSLIHI